MGWAIGLGCLVVAVCLKGGVTISMWMRLGLGRMLFGKESPMVLGDLF